VNLVPQFVISRRPYRNALSSPRRTKSASKRGRGTRRGTEGQKSTYRRVRTTMHG
jgi:hypothetical protein